MKKIILLVVAVLAFYACENDQSKTKKTQPAQMEEIKHDEEAAKELSGSEFAGELHCENCDMINFKIAFSEDKYYLKYALIGVKHEGHYEEGKFTLNNGLLTLESQDEKHHWKMKYHEGGIQLLDFNNTDLNPELMEKYQLKKIN